MKQTRTLATLAAALTLAFAPHAVAQNSVAIGMAAGVNQVPSLVAQDQGFFKEEGIDIDLKPVPRGQVAIEAVASGSIQFAESSHTSFIAAVNKGIPLVGVGVAARGYYGKFIASNENSELKTLQDLKGKRIGTQVGTGMHMVLLMLLEKEGLTEEDFQITNVRVNDMPAAMAAGGNFDAVLGWEPGMQRIVQGGFGKEIITARQIEEMAAITYPFIITTTEEYKAAHPDVVQGVVNAYAKAHAYIEANPDEATRIYKEYLDSTGANLDEATVKYMLFDTDRFGGVNFTDADWGDLVATGAFMVKTGELTEEPNLDAIVDRTLAEKAEAAN